MPRNLPVGQVVRTTRRTLVASLPSAVARSGRPLWVENGQSVGWRLRKLSDSPAGGGTAFAENLGLYARCAGKITACATASKFLASHERMPRCVAPRGPTQTAALSPGLGGTDSKIGVSRTNRDTEPCFCGTV
jgi:hypothetical protein